jgi:hypothetical protein
MDTHIHLLVRTTELPLWQLMKPLQSDYAHYYNYKYKRRGPLFADRFKSIATQDQYYLEQLLRYIHLNPIRAGICKTLAQLDRYPWSGHRMILKNDTSGFQEITQVLKRFGKSPEEAIKRYREFLEEGISTPPKDDFISHLRASNNGKQDKNSIGYWVIGDAAFQRTVLEKDAQNRIAIAQYIKHDIVLDDVLKETAKLMEIDHRLILKRSKRTPQASARMLFCFFARQLGFPTRETGNYLGIQQAAVTNAARQGSAIAQKNNFSWKQKKQ